MAKVIKIKPLKTSDYRGPVCATCLCSAEYEGESYLSCRRAPPQVFYDEDAGDWDSAWPNVLKDDWCIEWVGTDCEIKNSES